MKLCQNKLEQPFSPVKLSYKKGLFSLIYGCLEFGKDKAISRLYMNYLYIFESSYQVPKNLTNHRIFKSIFCAVFTVIWLPQGQPNLANWWRGSWALFSKTQLIIGYCLFLDIGHQKPRGEYESQNPGKLSGIRYRNLILVWLSFPLCRRLQLDSVTLYVIKNLCFD